MLGDLAKRPAKRFYIVSSVIFKQLTVFSFRLDNALFCMQLCVPCCLRYAEVPIDDTRGQEKVVSVYEPGPYDEGYLVIVHRWCGTGI